MTADQFNDLLINLVWVFGPLVPWLVIAYLVGSFFSGIMIFALVLLREI